MTKAQYAKFADSYGILSTVAGKGEIDNDEVGWKSEFENGLAIEAELTRPHYAMADATGNIYIADKDAHGIRKVTPDGKIQTIAGTNNSGDNGDGLGIECQLSSPNGLWVKSDGTVYILDLGNSKIRRLNTNGILETIVDDSEGIHLGRGIWVTINEDTIFYASLNQIKIWTIDKGIETYASGFKSLGNITQDKNGFLVATDRTVNVVYRISKDGSSKEIIAGNGTASGGGDGFLAKETGLNGVRGVWFLDDNSFFAATHEGSQIWYVDVVGKIHLFLNGKEGDEYHSGDGEKYNTQGYKISEPRSVSVDYNGNVIIVENDNGFVRKIKRDYVYYYTNRINKKDQRIAAFPNPVNNEVTISYYLSCKSFVNLKIYNLEGREVISIEKSYQSVGNNQIILNTEFLPEGIYLYTLKTENENISKQLIIAR